MRVVRVMRVVSGQWADGANKGHVTEDRLAGGRCTFMGTSRCLDLPPAGP